MERDFERIGEIVSRTHYEAPKGLLERILFVLELKKRRNANVMLVVYSFASLVTAALLALSLVNATAAFTANGTAQTLSLAFSDVSVVFLNWRYFFLSVLETMPVLSVSYVLIAMLLLSFLASAAFTNFRAVSHIARHKSPLRYG